MRSYFPNVDLLCPNETEAALLGAKLGEVPELVTTLGPAGFSYQHGGVAYQESPIPVHALDSTGAGDAFCGSLCYFLSLNIPMAHALTLASAYASDSVTKLGTSAAMATSQEFHDFLRKNRPEDLKLFVL
jgi:ribokinase